MSHPSTATGETLPAGLKPVAASFRDPGGSLVSTGGRILRLVNEAGRADCEAFLGSPRARALMAAGRVVDSRRLSEAEIAVALGDPACRALEDSRGPASIVLEHERIPFPSFPYEWPPEMLWEAGRLTLDLAQELLSEGLGVKDGTPYNVLFRGPEPVFIDVLSFERRERGDATWLAYAQFIRTFLLPLMANKYFGLGLDQILATRRDGLEPEEVYRWLSLFQKIRPPFLSLVSLPRWLGARHNPDSTEIYRKKLLDDPEKARFILDATLRGLRRALRRLAPEAGRHSTWTGYMASDNNYSREHFAAKEAFVEQALEEYSPQRVLDVGCNTGHFSALAARRGAAVVAADYDPVVLGSVWRNARAERLNILPLAVNLTRPTPPMGWRYQECPGFLDRARGHFDAVLMLAVIHHMLVTERVPLDEILGLAAELTTRLLVVEFIAPGDSMFRRLTRGRDELHRGLTTQVFESAVRRHFEIVRTQHLDGTGRWLYLLIRK